MAKGRNSIIISGILAAFVTGLLITVSTADAGAGFPPSESCVTFTVKGEDIPDSEQCNLEAFDLWVKFRGPATMQFTKDGDDVGLPIPKPKGTNDFHVEWDSVTCEFLTPPGLVWTKNGVKVATTTIPFGANDFDFEAKKIAQVKWGFPDEEMEDVPIPKGHVTDIHFDCVSPGGSGDPT